MRIKLLMVAAAACAMAPTSSRADEITVTASAGSWEKALRACYVEPFTKSTGIKVNVLPGTQVQWVNQIAASPAKPPIDVITNTMDSGYHAIELGIVDKMTEADAPNLKEINPAFVAAGRGYGTLLNFGAFGLAYNTTTVEARPASWKDFVEGTVRGDWKAALPSINVPAVPMTTIWLFSHLYGGGTDNVKPGLDQIKRMKDSGHVVFYRNVNEFLSLMKSGEADIGMYYDGRTWAFHDDGNPWIAYYNPEPGSVINPIMLQKVKNGSPLGWKLINYMLSAEAQTCWGNKMQYGMSNMNVRYSPTVAPRVPTMKDIIVPPYEEVWKLAPSWIDQWNREIGR